MVTSDLCSLSFKRAKCLPRASECPGVGALAGTSGGGQESKNNGLIKQCGVVPETRETQQLTQKSLESVLQGAKIPAVRKPAERQDQGLTWTGFLSPHFSTLITRWKQSFRPAPDSHTRDSGLPNLIPYRHIRPFT